MFYRSKKIWELVVNVSEHNIKNAITLMVIYCIIVFGPQKFAHVKNMRPKERYFNAYGKVFWVHVLGESAEYM